MDLSACNIIIGKKKFGMQISYIMTKGGCNHLKIVKILRMKKKSVFGKTCSERPLLTPLTVHSGPLTTMGS